MSKSVAIITPTTGSDDLAKCMESVKNQTYENITHHVVADGYEAYLKIKHNNQFTIQFHSKLSTSMICENVGANGWYGHRIYAAFPFLVNQEYVVFLDQDNWLEPNHIESLISTIEKGYQWAYSFRNIVDKDGTFICKDYESLGYKVKPEHIDTSCFMIPREILVGGVSTVWYGQYAADRHFYHNLKSCYPSYDATYQHTMNYRLGSSETSAPKEFYLQNNARVLESFNGKLPWE